MTKPEQPGLPALPLLLRNLLYATCLLIWAFFFMVMVPFFMSTIVGKGEAAFTRDDRYWLESEHPGGVYISEHEYKVCEGTVWMHFDSRHDSYTLRNESSCWRVIQ